MIAYKLLRRLKCGDLTSPFINNTERLQKGVWLEAEDYPTEGFKHRPGWHAMPTPHAPHLSTKGRVWVEVDIEDFEELQRPEHYGGTWYLAQLMKIIRVLDEEE